MLVCHCLADVFSQLQAIDPKNQSYTNKLANAQRDAKEFSAQTAAQVSVTLSDRGQIREIQKMLGSLDNIVVTMASSKGIQPTEASHYRKIIQRLMLKTALDELINPIREAMDEGNTALAIHYLEAAKGKMEQANEDGFYSDQITQYTARIEALVQSPPNADAEPATAQPASEKDSESFSDSGDSWKKKNLYD